MAGDKEHYDYLLKLIIIGDSGTGKSCLLHYLIEHRFKKNTTQTVGVEFGCKRIIVGGKKVKMQIWDTAGQERFRSVTRSYYRGAAGALIVYDITNPESYSHLSSWINDARALARPDIAIVVVGNKLDLKEERAVSFIDASVFCQEQEVQLLETSSITGENVEEAFHKLAKVILNKLDNGQLENLHGIQSGPGSFPPIYDRTCSC